MDFFIEILNLSLVSSYVIVFVLIARLLLKKAPKIYSYMLWIIVFVRLTCSFTFELPIGLIPESQPIQTDIIYQTLPEINTQINVIDATINTNFQPITEAEINVNPLQLQIVILKNIWLIGVVLMLGYNLFSYVKLKRNLIGSMIFKDNIYIYDYITSPFVIDVIKPKIYLPSDIKASEIDFIIAHEKTHIKRFDHVTRVVAFFVLSLHWFNPLVWCAYFLSGRDMELSCDEEVIKKTNSDIRKEYSQSLLNFASGRVITTPAFGVNITIDTKERIKNIMKFKKPVAWVTALAITSVTVLSIGCMATTSTDNNTSINYVSNNSIEDELYKLTIDKNDISFSGLNTSKFFSGSGGKYNHYNLVFENIKFSIAGNEVDLGEQNIATINIDEEENNLLVTFDIETNTKSKISYEFNIDKTDNSFNLIKNNTSSDFNDIITTDVITMLALEIYDYSITKDDISFNGVGEVGNNKISDILQPFSTSTSASTSSSTSLINDASQNKLFADYYGEISLTQEGSNFYFPDIYISPNNMAIFTLNRKGLPLLNQTDLEISYNLGNNESLTLETGIIFDNDYIQINQVKGIDFLESYTTNSPGEHYVCIVNRTSENAIIQNGIIKVNGELVNQNNSRIAFEKDGMIISTVNKSDLVNILDVYTTIMLEDLELNINGENIYLGDQNYGYIYAIDYDDNYTITMRLFTDINLPNDYDPLLGELSGESIYYSFVVNKTDGTIITETNEIDSYFDDIITTNDIEKLCMYFYDFVKTQTQNTTGYDDSNSGEVSIQSFINQDNSRFNYKKDGITFSFANTNDLFHVSGNTTMIISKDVKFSIDGKDIYLDESKDTLISVHENEAEQGFSFILHSNITGEHITYNFWIDNDGNITRDNTELSEYFEELITLDDIENICIYFYEVAKTQTHNTTYYDDSYGGEVSIFESEENETIVE